MSRHIVILDRGWAFVGDLTKTETGYELRDAHNIRRWGTTAGLGQLAASGPTPETKLDPAGTVNFPTFIAAIACTGWAAS